MQELVTLVGAVIAAIAGILNLWKTFVDQTDRIYVKTGLFRPIATPATSLYVVNTAKHPVTLSDYGFVLEDGKLFSIPWYDENEAVFDGVDNHAFYLGNSTIPPRDMFAVGISFNEKIIGSFAVTTTQSRYRVHMMQSCLNPIAFYKWLSASFNPTYGN
ncbi:hypothetical protein [Methylophilus sp. Leaf408]|uniref:hypothetical protein n=1 Tax=Methylophilus sp. Leaf408 TaxID=2876561 RepID=UPI001E32AA8C|nr:hypothetical protein [Methylophilus sp. Leaf408]